MKKFIAMLMLVAMVLSMAACGASESSAPAASSSSDEAAFKIGGIGPITGDAAIYGQAV